MAAVLENLKNLLPARPTILHSKQFLDRSPCNDVVRNLRYMFKPRVRQPDRHQATFRIGNCHEGISPSEEGPRSVSCDEIQSMIHTRPLLIACLLQSQI